MNLRRTLWLVTLMTAAAARAQDRPPLPDLQPCGEAHHLNVTPINLEDLASIRPLGGLNPPIHVFPISHTSFDTVDGASLAPIYSPGVLVLQLVHRDRVTNLETSEQYEEYGLDFGVCGGVKLRLGHIGSISSRVTEAIAGQDPLYHSDSTHGAFRKEEDVFFLAIQFRPGESIGAASGKSSGFDFGAYDLNSPPLAFIHPERYGAEGRYNVCPIDLFIPPLKAVLEARLGSGGFVGLPFERRLDLPVCGTVNQDVAGTLQGHSFYDTSTQDPEDRHLALVHDNIHTEIPVFSIGETVPLLTPSPSGFVVSAFPAGLYRFTSSVSGLVNTDFDATSVGTGYCYDNLIDGNGNPVLNTIVRVFLAGPETLKIEAVRAPGLTACPVRTSYGVSPFAVEFNR